MPVSCKRSPREIKNEPPIIKDTKKPYTRKRGIVLIVVLFVPLRRSLTLPRNPGSQSGTGGILGNAIRGDLICPVRRYEPAEC